MKEIDFLPEWYKKDRRWQIGYRTQYIILSCIFIIMMIWNFAVARTVSSAAAEMTEQRPKISAAGGVSLEYEKIGNKMKELQKKASILEEVDSKINVADVLGEMSFLVDEKIALSRIDLRAEKIVGGQDKQDNSKSGVRIINGVDKNEILFGDVQFKVVISGVAGDAGDVAKLICKLEDSPYFCQVVLLFSRNKKMINAGPGFSGEGHQVSEFEISCYLANYVQSYVQTEAAKEPQNNNFKK